MTASPNQTPAHSARPSAPAPRSPFHVKALVPTPKRTHASPRRIVKLMDLPDEPLLRIIADLSEPDGIGRRSVVLGPPAFPLALTCTRLFTLFQIQALRHIDALHPETYAPFQSRAIDGQVRDLMLSAIIRMAGKNLRSIHFPRDSMAINRSLDEIANHRIPLRQLSYCDYITPIDEDKERAVFMHMGQLRRLCVFNPRGALRFMHHATKLEDLELTGVRPNAMSSLITALRKVGPTLRKLCVGFHSDGVFSIENPGITGVSTPMWCVSSFARYLSSRLSQDLPRLEALDVSGSRCSHMCHQGLIDRQNSSFTPTAVELGESINMARERNALSASAGRLRRLVIRAVFGAASLDPHMCLVPFRSLITPNVDVYMQLVGMTVLYPAASLSPQFKSLQITYQDLTVLPASAEVDCTHIEVMDLGTNLLCKAYSRHEIIREKVMNLVWESTDVLRELNVEIEVDCAGTMKNTCLYIGDVLEISPNVDVLSFRTGMVDFCDEGESCFERLLHFMTKIRILRLTTHPEHSAQCKLAFARNLPFFLDSIAESCPDLECLFLELAMPVQAASIAAAEVRNVAMESYYKCKSAVEALEADLPQCDVTSVRSQLVVWHRYLDPMNWPLLFRTEPDDP